MIAKLVHKIGTVTLKQNELCLFSAFLNPLSVSTEKNDPSSKLKPQNSVRVPKALNP